MTKEIEITCSKTGVKFQYEVKRGRPPVNHPEITKILTEAYNFGWHSIAMKTIEEGKAQGFTAIEQFIEALRNAEKNTHHSTYPRFMYEKGLTPGHVVRKQMAKEQSN